SKEAGGGDDTGKDREVLYIIGASVGVAGIVAGAVRAGEINSEPAVVEHGVTQDGIATAAARKHDAGIPVVGDEIGIGEIGAAEAVTEGIRAGTVGADVVVLDGEVVVDNLIFNGFDAVELVAGNNVALGRIGTADACVNGLGVLNPPPVGQSERPGEVSAN